LQNITAKFVAKGLNTKDDVVLSGSQVSHHSFILHSILFVQF